MAKYSGTLSGSTTYSSVIGKAITDFDAIFDALYNKSVVDLSGTALSTDTTGVATEDYATLITRQLYRVAGVTNTGVITAPSGVIANYTGASSTLTATPTITYSGDSATLVVRLKDPGYYDSTSSISTTFSTTTVSLSGELNKASTTPYSYVAGAQQGDPGTFKVSAPADSALKEVNIAEGSLSVSIPNAGVTNASTNDIDFTIQSTGIGSNATLTEPAAADLENYVTLSVRAGSTVTNTITVTPTVSFSAGYISTGPSLSQTVYPTINESEYAETATVYLPKGSAQVSFSGGGMTVTDDQTHAIISSTSENASAEAPANTYEIKVESASGTLTGTTTTGWVTGGSNVNMGSVAGAVKRLFINKGTVPDNSVSVHLSATSSVVDVNSQDADAYTVTIGRLSSESATSTTSITEGYITDDSYTTTTTVNGLTLSIPVGKAVIQDTLTSVTYEYTGGNIGLADAPLTGDYYTITPKVNVAASIDSSSGATKQGYLVPGATTVIGSGLTNASGNPVYIKKGSVSLTKGMSTTSGSGSILLSSAPSGGVEGTDYYKITTNDTLTVTEGYITSNEVSEGLNANYYVPKAQLAYIENSSAGAIIQATSAGYVPSGTIVATSGTLDMAAVLASLSDTGSVLKTTGSTGDYAISIAKAATTNAGYISGSSGEGSVSLNDTYYIGHGSFTSSPVISTLTFGSVVADHSNNQYTVLATATGTNDGTTNTLVEGYIKSADLTINAIANKTATLTLPEATLDVTLGSATLSTEVVGMDTAVSSAYYITPSLENATAQASVSSAGYVDTTVTSSQSTITLNNQTAPKTYIKAGTTSSITDSNAATATVGNLFQNAASTAQGTNYTASITGTATVTGTLADGYYGAAGSNNSITTTKSITGSVTVAHGQAVVNPTAATVDFTTTGITRVTNLVSESATHFEAITASVPSVTLSRSGSTTGYISTANSTDWVLGTALSSSNESTFYIRKYAYAGDSGSTSTAVSVTTYDNASVYTPTYSSFASNDGATDGIVNDIVLNTAQTFNDKNILVKLSADAAGSNVVADLTRLSNRLAGTLVRSGA